MADSMLVNSLSDLVRPDNPFEWMRTPFTITIRDIVWTVATDGKGWLVGVRGRSSFTPLIRDDSRVQTVRRCLDFEPNGSAIQVKTEAFRSWVGPVPQSNSFSRDLETPDGIVVGVPVDKRRLAWLLQRMPFPEITLWNSTADLGLNSVGLKYKAQWLCILAGVESSDDDGEKLPRFPERSLDLLEDLPQE